MLTGHNPSFLSRASLVLDLGQRDGPVGLSAADLARAAWFVGADDGDVVDPSLDFGQQRLEAGADRWVVDAAGGRYDDLDGGARPVREPAVAEQVGRLLGPCAGQVAVVVERTGRRSGDADEGCSQPAPPQTRPPAPPVE